MRLRFPSDAVVVVAGVPGAEMERQVARWRRLMARIPRGEGWASVVVLDREQAASTSELAFVAPVTSKAAAATM